MWSFTDVLQCIAALTVTVLGMCQLYQRNSEASDTGFSVIGGGAAGLIVFWGYFEVLARWS